MNQRCFCSGRFHYLSNSYTCYKLSFAEDALFLYFGVVFLVCVLLILPGCSSHPVKCWHPFDSSHCSDSYISFATTVFCGCFVHLTIAIRKSSLIDVESCLSQNAERGTVSPASHLQLQNLCTQHRTQFFPPGYQCDL